MTFWLVEPHDLNRRRLEPERLLPWPGSDCPTVKLAGKLENAPLDELLFAPSKGADATKHLGLRIGAGA